MVKNPPANAGDTKDVGLIPRSERSPEVGNGNPLQYSCLEDSMDRGAWQDIVHGVAKSWRPLSTHIHKLKNRKVIFLPATQVVVAKSSTLDPRT